MYKRNHTISTPFFHQADEEAKSPPIIQESPAEDDTERFPTHKSFGSLASIPEDKKDTRTSGLNTSQDPGLDMMTILKKTERSDKEAFFLYNKIKDFRFFTQFIENIDEYEREQAVTYMCKKLEYVTYEMGEVIMKQGSFSDGKVCITLSGELLVMVNSFPSASVPVSPKASASEKEEEKREEVKEEKREASPVEELARLNSNKSQDSGQHNVTRRSMSLSRSRSDLRQSPLKTFGLLSPQAVPVMEEEEPEECKPELHRKSVLHLQKLPVRQPTIAVPAARPSIDFDNLATLNILKKEKPDQKTEKTQGQQEQSSEDPFAGQDMLQRNYGLVVNKLYGGSYFGERALFKKHRRTATIVANSFVEILKLGVEDFEYVLSEFNKTKKLMMRFLRDIFPNLDEVQTPILLENLSYTYNIKNCNYHHVIMSEGNRGDEFYVIYEGKCELIKTMIYDRSDNLSPNMAEAKSLYRMRKTTKEEILVMTLERGMIFGEEIIFNADPVYEYTVRVSSEKAKLMSFKKQKFLYKCPKVVLQGLNDVYSNKKERINKNLIDRLEKKGTKASAGMLEDVKSRVAFPKTMTTYGPDLHKKQRGNTLQFLITSNVLNTEKSPTTTSFPNIPKSFAAFEEGTRVSPSRLIKPLQLETPKSPKSGRFDGVFSTRDNDPRKGGRTHSQGPRTYNQIKTGSPEPGHRSGGASPQRSIHSPYHKLNGIGDGVADQIERLKARNDVDMKDIGSHNNMEGVFKVDFGKVDKNMDKKYKAYKVKQGLIKTSTNLVELSKGSSLADFLAHRLKEKNYIKDIKEPQGISSLNTSPRIKNQYEGFPSFNSIFLDSSPNEPISAKLMDSQTSTRRVDVRKLTFMQDLSIGVGSKEQLSPVLQHIPTKKQSPQLMIKPLFNKKELVMDEHMKKPVTPKKLGKSLSIISPSVVKMDVNYSSGLAMKMPKEKREG